MQICILYKETDIYLSSFLKLTGMAAQDSLKPKELIVGTEPLEVNTAVVGWLLQWSDVNFKGYGPQGVLRALRSNIPEKDDFNSGIRRGINE